MSQSIHPPMPALALQWLTDWRTASLATVDADGLPHACNIQFAWDGQRLLFVSSDQTAHGQHLAQSKKVALTIYAHVEDRNQIHGLQIKGDCQPVADAQRPAATQHYMQTLSLPSEWQAKIDSQTLYAITPHWLCLIDNRQGFGFKQTWERHQPSP